MGTVERAGATVAGRRLDNSVFRTPVSDQLALDRAVLVPIELGGVRESLRRVTLLRPADLLAVELSFVGLVLEDGAEGRVLRRADGAPTGYLRVLFGGQHLHERAFFAVTPNVAVNTLGGASETPPRPQDTDNALPPPDPDPVVPPPVPTRIAGESRLVFRVREERIPYTLDGILAAMRTLPLSVVPHADGAGLAIDVSTSVRAVAGLHAGAVGRTLVSGALRSASRTLGAAALLQERFGAVAASAAMVAAHTGPGGFRLDAGAARELRKVAEERLTLLGRLPAEPREPSPTETALELPWRLQLSPHSGSAFAHGTRAAASADGRVELWHTRLGSRTAGGVDESSRDARTVRAVWARDFDETPGFAFHPQPLPATEGKEFPEADQSQDVPRWRSPLNSRDRMMLVHETSNFRLSTARGLRYTPPAVGVDRLMLSSLGGWLASDFETAPPQGNVTIQEWVHRAALGRDSYVKVVYAGFLLPFLHPASLVKVTERKVREGTAYLFQRMYVVVREPFHSYGSTQQKLGNARIDLAMPFTSVRILTPSTPDLEPPSDITPGISGYMFTPASGGAPFRFRMLGIDLDGRSVEFDGPLVFAEYDHNASSAVGTTIDAFTAHAPTFDLRGQKVAFAASSTADDTSLATRSMTFDLVTNPQIKARGQDVARAEPMLRTAQTIVPAMSALAGAGGAVAVQYPADYLEKQFASTNAAQVFLELVTPVALDFSTQSDRSGGFVAPSLGVSALSRSLGPVGGPVAALVKGGDGFDISKYFPASAKLFGLVSLSELVPSGFHPSALPQFVAQSVDAATMLTTNLERMGSLAGRLATTGPAALLGPLQQVADRAGDLLATVAALAVSDAGSTADKLAAVGAAVVPLRNPLVVLGSELVHDETLLRSDREALDALVQRVVDQLGSTPAETTALLRLLELAAGGATLPETVRARLDWSTDLQPWPKTAPIFAPRNNVGKLTLAVDVQAPTKPGGQPSALVSCAISAFQLRLIGDVPFITLSFERLEFSSVPGRKTDVNVVFTEGSGVTFGGPLSFVETLRAIIPFDGFSDPPSLEVSASGIKAGFDLAIPTVAMGVFSLSNVTFIAGFEVPFIGESIAVRFAFSSRHDPFRLQVSFFAGGGFFAVVITPKEVRELEAALEFGAAVALDFGVASGSVSVMAGVYFRLRTQDGRTDAQLTGYFRARGEVDVLGIITACIEIYLELSYETGSGKAVGRASISIEVSVCLLSFSVSLSCEKKFAGSSGDPTFAAVMGVHPRAAAGTARPWDEYCDAFAR